MRISILVRRLNEKIKESVFGLILSEIIFIYDDYNRVKQGKELGNREKK